MNCCQRLQKVAKSPINRQIWSHWLAGTNCKAKQRLALLTLISTNERRNLTNFNLGLFLTLKEIAKMHLGLFMRMRFNLLICEPDLV